jgi:hypothetical protein
VRHSPDDSTSPTLGRAAVEVRRSFVGCRRIDLWEWRLSHVESDIAPVAHDLRADLDQLLLEARQRPILDRLGRRERAQKIAEIY